jgi:hypothetical protein
MCLYPNQKSANKEQVWKCEQNIKKWCNCKDFNSSFNLLAGFKITFSFIKTKVLHHTLDAVTNPKYKLLCFLTTKKLLQTEEGTNF